MVVIETIMFAGERDDSSMEMDSNGPPAGPASFTAPEGTR